MRKVLVLVSAFAAGCGSEITRGDGGPGGHADFAAAPDDGGTKPFDRDAACAQVSAEATLGKRPVDVIIVVDNSGSMTEEITSVEKNLNVNFAQIIGASGLDYRVILVSKYGSASKDQSICIGKPLSGNTCPPTGPPINTATFFHYDTEIDSHNSFTELLRTYNAPDPNGKAPGGWSDWVRDGSMKVFLEITDDDANMTAVDFDKALLALAPARFGDAKTRDYVFQSIVGLKEKNNKTQPYLPNEPVQGDQCCHTLIILVCTDGAEGSGDEYQRASIMTGGLRFPICQYDSYDAVFKEIAKGVIAGSKVACDFALPMAPMGQDIDLDSVVVEYLPGSGGMAQDLQQVKDATQCAPNSFYIDKAKGRIYLCPDACKPIQADAMAKVNVLFDCTVPVQ